MLRARHEVAWATDMVYSLTQNLCQTPCHGRPSGRTHCVLSAILKSEKLSASLTAPSHVVSSHWLSITPTLSPRHSSSVPTQHHRDQ